MEDKKKVIEYMVYGLLIIALLFGDLPIFTFIYVLAAMYLCYNSFKSESSLIEKLFRCGTYILIMSFQLTFNALITYGDNIFLFLPMMRRLIATILILVPFIIEKYVIVNKYESERKPLVENQEMLPDEAGIKDTSVSIKEEKN